MEVSSRTRGGVKPRTVTVDERVFGLEPKRPLLHQALVAQLANQRQGTADTLTRSQVAGSGRKMWRQKGTGRARQGSKRAPHWRGGGTVFGPHPRSYHKHVPRQMRRLALRSALSDKMAAGGLVIVDSFELEDGRTKTLMTLLEELDLHGRLLVILPERDENVRRAAGNLSNVFVGEPGGFTLLQVVNAETVVVVGDALDKITEMTLRPRRSSPLGEAADA